MMELGADGVFVGSGIFKSENPEKFARAIVEATTHYQDYKLLVEISKDLGIPMKGIEISRLAAKIVCKIEDGKMVKIGVLALQGAVSEHIKSIEAMWSRSIIVKHAEDLAGVDGLNPTRWRKHSNA